MSAQRRRGEIKMDENLCQYKRGFFTLRSCSRQIFAACQNCKQAACHFHMSAKHNRQICVECDSSKSVEDLQNYDSQDWFYGYRGWYYQSGYAPYRLGEGDYSSFENHDDSVEDWDDDYAGDFYDS